MGTPLLPFLVLIAVMALPPLPVPTAKEAADDWTLEIDDRPGARGLEAESPVAMP